MKLSVCMMVKNEEKNLKKCLDSLNPILNQVKSELIIVDTGSTDNTVEIAKKYTDKVFFHQWNKDFAQMRNITINYAKGEWIFIIDGDEEVENTKPIVKFLTSNDSKKFNTATLAVRNIMNLDKDYESILLTSPRFFRNDGEFKYIGAVHNNPVFKKPITYLDATILHYGYIYTDKELMEKKFIRTSEILKGELNKNPDSVYYRHQLSVTYAMHKDHREALKEAMNAYDTMKKLNVDPKDFLYLYGNLVKSYINNNMYTEAEKICIEGISLEEEHLDLYCYLGKVCTNLKNYHKAVDAYNRYLKLLVNYKDLSIVRNGRLTVETTGYSDFVYLDLITIYFNQPNYQKVIEYSNCIGHEEILLESISITVEAYIKMKMFKELKEFYQYKIISMKSEPLKEKFILALELCKNFLPMYDRGMLNRIFSGEEDSYGCLNKVRVQFEENKKELYKYVEQFNEKYQLAELPFYYGDILYYFIYLNKPIRNITFNISEINLEAYLEHINRRYAEIDRIFGLYLDNFCTDNSFFHIRVAKILSKYILLSENISKELYEEVFLNYINYGIKYVKYIYSDEIIDNELIHDVKNNEEAFFLYMCIAQEKRRVEEAQYINYLRKALQVYPSISKGMKIIFEKMKQGESAPKELEQMKIHVKENILLLVNNNKVEDARALINEYETIVEGDMSIYPLKANVMRLEGKDKAGEKLLEEKWGIKKEKVLILCHFYSVYTKEYLEHINKSYNASFDILTMDSSYRNNVSQGALNNIHVYNKFDELKEMINNLGFYDVIHIHFLTPIYGDLADMIRKKCKRLIITIWGSDFYRASEEQKLIQKHIIAKSDVITFDNEVTMEEFIKEFKVDNIKTELTRFGLTALEYIDSIRTVNVNKIKEELDIPKDTVVVTCGYNANPAHNHLEIIKTLNDVKDKLPKNIYFIFPMTYGREEAYVTTVKNTIAETGLNYKILEEFMNFDEVAKATRISDIMIQVQTTDTWSASMQEHMYNGNIIVTGSWFPYQPLKDAGLYFLEVSAVKEVGNKLLEALDNFEEMKEKCKGNKEIVWNLSSWSNNIKSWIKIYEIKVEKNNMNFDHGAYWDYRYGMKFNIEASGYMGLGTIYNKYLYKSRLDILRNLVGNLYGSLQGKDVLELGPGTGVFTEFFREEDIKSYYGIEISRKAVDWLSKRYKIFNFKIGDVSELNNYPKHSKFDLIFASDVLLHLTNNDSFEKAIRNISDKLKENGYFIEIDPITLTGATTSVQHNRIIKIEELIQVLQKNDLEIVNMIPVTFFMDYPFDYNLRNEEGIKALNAFNDILNYFSSSRDNEELKEEMANTLYILDKICLEKYQQGLSNKVLVIRKKKNNKIKESYNVQFYQNSNELIPEQFENIQNIIRRSSSGNVKKIFSNILDFIDEKN